MLPASYYPPKRRLSPPSISLVSPQPPQPVPSLAAVTESEGERRRPPPLVLSLTALLRRPPINGEHAASPHPRAPRSSEPGELPDGELAVAARHGHWHARRPGSCKIARAASPQRATTPSRHSAVDCARPGGEPPPRAGHASLPNQSAHPPDSSLPFPFTQSLPAESLHGSTQRTPRHTTLP